MSVIAINMRAGEPVTENYNIPDGHRPWATQDGIAAAVHDEYPQHGLLAAALPLPRGLEAPLKAAGIAGIRSDSQTQSTEVFITGHHGGGYTVSNGLPEFRVQGVVALGPNQEITLQDKDGKNRVIVRRGT